MIIDTIPLATGATLEVRACADGTTGLRYFAPPLTIEWSMERSSVSLLVEALKRAPKAALTMKHALLAENVQ